LTLSFIVVLLGGQCLLATRLLRTFKSNMQMQSIFFFQCTVLCRPCIALRGPARPHKPTVLPITHSFMSNSVVTAYYIVSVCLNAEILVSKELKSYGEVEI
jgi:hypothetical protein